MREENNNSSAGATEQSTEQTQTQTEQTEQTPAKKQQDTIVIDKSKKYSAEEVEALVLKARQSGHTTAKNQLQDEIIRLRKIVDDKKSDSNGSAAKTPEEIEAEKLKAEKDALEKSEAQRQIEELSKKLKVMEDGFVEEASKREAIEKDLARERLELYKKGLIAEAKGALFVSLVRGNTKEEIDASFVEAKKAYADEQEKLRKEMKLPSEPTPEEIEARNKPLDIKRISLADKAGQEEYKKVRNTQIRQAYERAGLVFED